MREQNVSANNKLSIQYDNRKPNVSAMQFPTGSNAALLQPEQPVMRSVTLAPPLTALRSRNEHAPHIGLERPPMLKKLEVNGEYVNNKQQVTFSKSVNAEASNWNVVNDSLRCVPDHYILEKTSCFVGETTASVISARISNCLRTRSIEASFNDSKAKAKCVNSDWNKFNIRLYSGRGEYCHGVIVEVQRRSGNSLSLKKDCNAIFDAAKGIRSKETPRKPLRPVREMSFFNGLPSKPAFTTEPDITQNAFDLIMENSLDTNILGMESLCTLTDLNHSTQTAVFEVSAGILSSNRKILAKILSTMKNDNDVNNEGDYIDNESPHFCKLRSLALTVIVNILNLAKLDSNFIINLRSQPLFVDDVLSVLVECVKNPKGHFFEATIASKGLSALLSSELHHSVKQKLQEIGGVAALGDANVYGLKYHSLLAKETELCLNAFECH